MGNVNTSEGMVVALNAYAIDFKAWSSATFGQIPKKIQEKRKRISSLVQADTNGLLGDEINQTMKEINELLNSEVIYWCQHFKAHWLKEGDRNIKFFYARASERRKQNTILGIWDKSENWCGDQDSIARVAISYFEEIYTTSSPSQIEKVTDLIPIKVTDEMNMEPTRGFTKEEVVAALKQLHPTKSPGPNSMSALFFQKY